ncbi:DegT/DnrJ/EryC1/StrS family aminotransferase [Asticcacaulis sp. BYS171W]|uniref:DegT/DnrJ/EryC1/StrS family aminotransferase n=1 Tax=Asticcacaulis aquaticus TaxID=2984212 RepID=A0ABT5HQK3_9CAUL|nr:DegT/DnrJ/EryC1/StrS family aminotransferase [Asticcacaulis aquaticus]MDC7681741.1 DegT/DnrJ/EryC1/StrS family aminotransferase [Asticcacaulis aquaticus]
MMYLSVKPDLPTVEDVLPYLRQIHSNARYSNFGPLSTELEAGLLSAFGSADTAERCVCVSNATSGLTAALLAAGVNGKVAVPAFTFPASLGAVCSAGATPVIFDVSIDKWAFDEIIIEDILKSENISAVMIVEAFGILTNIENLIRMCLSHGVKVIIDSAAGLGVRRTGRVVHPDVFEIFSMHATKPLGIGEGGCVFMHNSRVSNFRAAINFALPVHQDHTVYWGFNGKMSEYHAAVGLAQLRRRHVLLQQRQGVVTRYIEQIKLLDGLIFSREVAASPWQFFPIRLPDEQTTESFVDLAAQKGVEIRRYYRPSLASMYQNFAHNSCLSSEQLSKTMCALPVRSGNAIAEMDEIIDAVLDSLKGAMNYA